MTDRLDFESRLEARLVAHAADVVRPFDAGAIAAAAAAGAPRRTLGLGGPWRSSQINRTPLAAALLLLGMLLAIVGALLLTGSKPTLRAVVAPTASAPASPKPRLAPTGYPGTGTIAFGRVDPIAGGETTWLIDPDGRRESAFRVATGWGGTTALPGTGCCPIISPSGKWIAVGYDEVNPARGAGSLATAVVLNLDGSHQSSVPGMCGSCASTRANYLPRAWSAGERLLALELWNDAETSHDGIALATCMILCSSEDWDYHATGVNRDVPVAFSPDGKELLFVRIQHDRLGTLMVLTIGPRQDNFPEPVGAIRQVSPDGMLVYADSSFGTPASWAPDGSRIAFAATDAAGNVHNMRAYVVASAAGAPTPLTAAGASVSSASWSPDGAWIAFDRVVAGTATHDLYVIRPDGTGETNLTTGFDPETCCARWSPDSTALLAAGKVTDAESDLFIVPISGAPIYQVTTVPGVYADFSWGSASR